MNQKNVVGFYGKLPVVGDFVSRHLPHEFIKPWDGWLQSSIAASRETLGDAWLRSYLPSPIWRFLLSPGLCGDKAVAGVMMPSVDNVGRYFPLTIAVVFDQPPELPLFFTRGNVWFEQLEDVALAGLNDNLDINGFDQLLQSIPVFSLANGAGAAQMPTDGKKYFYTAMDNISQIGDAFVSLNAQLLASFMPGYSLWGNEGSNQVIPALIACEGLPAISRFVDFLNSKVHPDEAPMQGSLVVNADKPSDMPDLNQQSLSSILSVGEPSKARTGWCSWAITHVGKRRKHNEDSVLDRPEAGLWVVADGMGGHKAGDVASQLIVNTLKNIPATTPLEDYVRDIESSLQSVNTQLRQLSAKEYGNQLVGSTVVALVCELQYCAFLWAGDSRLYRLRDNKLQQLTQDHCIDDGQMPSDLAFKSTNVITRAIGAEDGLDLAIEMVEVLAGDVFLLCSDGLDKEMNFKEIEHIMKCKSPQDIAEALITEVLARGARDNVSVIVVAEKGFL
ncbi:MAG: type VI secretion system-associated protein TagF [Methylococcales bacterium]|nr:type VI secretion system-associated protein TagF [Methylococcales bacterium]